MKISKRHGQSAIEYLLILTVIAIIVLAGFKHLLPNITKSQDPGYTPDSFFSRVTRVISGENPKPINGGWCEGGVAGVQSTCECPAPAFGGKYCL